MGSSEVRLRCVDDASVSHIHAYILLWSALRVLLLLWLRILFYFLLGSTQWPAVDFELFKCGCASPDILDDHDERVGLVDGQPRVFVHVGVDLEWFEACSHTTATRARSCCQCQPLIRHMDRPDSDQSVTVVCYNIDLICLRCPGSIVCMQAGRQVYLYMLCVCGAVAGHYVRRSLLFRFPTTNIDRFQPKPQYPYSCVDLFVT